jgi:hypothetical protein
MESVCRSYVLRRVRLAIEFSIRAVYMERTIQSPEELFEELRRYVRWLSSRKSRANNVLMMQDELEGELSLELFKGWLYYNDKGLSDGELLAVVRRMLDNRISELMRMYYRTSRLASSSNESLDDNVNVPR